MPTYATPGVYYEATDLDSGQINPLRTDIAAFVGIAERGALHTPVAVTTWEQYQSTFGNFISQGYLAYAVKAFFENGGERCQIVRIASAGATTSTSGAVQPADGHSSIALSTVGFIKGAVVTARLDDTHQADHLLADVNPATMELIWQVPLEPALRGVALDFATGPSPSAGVLLDALAQPTIAITASSPGIWGNQLDIEASHASSTATSTRNAIQPATRLASLVSSVGGFAPGMLVKVFQNTGGPSTVEYHAVTAVDSGRRAISWDTALAAAFDLTKPISLESVEFSISVKLQGKVMEVFTGLSLLPSSAQYVETAINGTSLQIQVKDLGSGSPRPKNLPDPAASNLSNGLLELAGGRDGLAALQVLDFTGAPSDITKRGIRTLEDVDEVAIVAVPDILIQPSPPVAYTPPIVETPDPCALCPAPPAPAPAPPPPLEEAPPTFSLDDIYYVQQALIDHCEAMRYRIAVLDPPLFSVPGEARELQEIQSWRQRFDSKYAALYFPWAVVFDPLQLGGSPVRMVPPSGHVVGTYANSDLTVGVHRAPANFELRWIQDLPMKISPVEQGLLNPEGINCLRTFPARGLRVYGARTVSSDPSWIYVNVRRLMMMIQKAVEYSLQWAVFEPNNAQLRLAVTSALTVFLESVYEAGALAGATDREAFFVKCDAKNNPPELSAVGQFVAEVGVAPAIPAEFIVFRVGRTQDRLEVTE
jgi:phage tail sheath protein FI